jgi:hypothetical protein
MKREIKKNGKLVDEIVSYLLKKGHHQLKIDLNYTTEYTEFTIYLNNLTDNERELLNECFSQLRDDIMEEYGWELLGESSQSAELNLIGMLIDDYRMETEGDVTIIYILRNH